ncbi:MAG: zinc-binding alcohol dehydrogenase family protein [Lactobacillaceae bacterium]|jgi:zinc-binding alcohol dehydrogenase family protein|nr:zinc-binding alcohol dehydrogenase family protein [Lactobacillaceae bacterium]
MTELMNALITTSDKDAPFSLSKIPMPEVFDQDVLVEVQAVSVNPVDTKQRTVAVANGSTKVLGYDAVGTISAIGSKVTKFKVGDKIMYAGELGRTGSNAQFEAVHENLAALAPEGFQNAQLAGVPLTFLTAYELLVDKFGLIPDKNANDGQTILIINGAGGVGSSMIQLAKWMGLKVIATASRPETKKWVLQLGATHVVNHREDYVQAIHELGYEALPYIAILHDPNQHFEQAAELISAFGHIGSIVENQQPLPMNLIKNKAASFDWEFMFAKANYQFDTASQGAALALAARLIENGEYLIPVTQTLHGMTAETLLEGHHIIEANNFIGKLTIEY